MVSDIKHVSGVYSCNIFNNCQHN